MKDTLGLFLLLKVCLQWPYGIRPWGIDRLNLAGRNPL